METNVFESKQRHDLRDRKLLPLHGSKWRESK